MGRTIEKLSQVIPDGLLIFFPSYHIMDMSKKSWEKSGVWSTIEESKPIFVEPRTKDVFTATIKNFYKQINNPNRKGAIFMAVCRGRVSEGLDFADLNGRAVIVTGIPFPPLKDAKIRSKRDYMQVNFIAGNNSLSGSEWYNLEALRAVNQAIGRVIRHKEDYGSIIFCDHRYNQTKNQEKLSLWVRNHMNNEYSTKSFQSTMNSITTFFDHHRTVRIFIILSFPGKLKENYLRNLAIRRNDYKQFNRKWNLFDDR